MKQKNTKGFTLIELLVVVAIIGLLMAFITVSLSSSRRKARDGRRVADIHQLRTGLEFYYNQNGSYPTTGMTANTGYGLSTLASLMTTWIATMPVDPSCGSSACTSGNIDYQYTYKDSGQNYGIRVYYPDGSYCKVMTAGGDPSWWSNAPLCGF